ncbi:DNA repair protein Pso2/Snm1, putative [Penicillium digitatum PHI26]|uniref:DNA repair protein Pso2/Snm1, putative n=2 Tax=Penicillium digitatum TaxID=36651 RepID=K9FZK0_PEND2|nr:DNA repair protein Pso2/Snm1, putative [Penicillium digitatum Pd1]EKV06391.1 DNA repair protein Pso2/Snm1, putative [Penicillium digitatum PHI26]EKV21590.1 DNA repair protein Pso2/Snm1, putative [Penicillium digitatum Pd1]
MAGSYPKNGTTSSKGSSGSRKSSIKRNSSILSFFQKTDTPPGATSRQARITQFATVTSRSPSSGRGTPTSQRGDNSRYDHAGGLFLEDKKGLANVERAAATSERERSLTPDIWGDDEEFLKSDPNRYNERDTAVKRRKLDSLDSPADETRQPDAESKTTKAPTPAPAPAKTKKMSGPFIDESDSENDMEAYRELHETTPVAKDVTNDTLQRDKIVATERTFEPTPLPLVRAATNADDNESTNFDDIEEEDEFVGEEFRNRPWEGEEQEQQVDLEVDPDKDSNDSSGVEGLEGEVSTCPICQVMLKDLDETAISVHVNECLDGKSNPSPATPAPKAMLKPTPKPANIDKGLTRAERAAIARPAQVDPYSHSRPIEGSAFSKMMAGNAEDTAWATAAANELSSRGKQAYQRTCPFYKILPGFSICVDAFRYGAVEGCNAYFLSHFHSDHYIGLSKSWCHGPIYCSRPTANLVRQQLRVDPKWVVDLEFESTTEVPETGGVRVTMIHANHCPGSSLFLFEKSYGNSPNASKQRVLHCGDFRASPAQVQHPLLRPDVIIPVTGKPRQQHIDKCYLDTTYLSPKYGFPAQEDVITACSELCVRLNHETGVGLDAGKNDTGGLMGKFLSVATGINKALDKGSQAGGRLLVVIGTYSIGKERICMGIARALGSKIFATPPKQRICACLEDPELTAMLTNNPHEAQVHMQTLFEIRADTLADYLDGLKPHFSRVVGFRPTGWTYRPPAGRLVQNPPVSTVLHGENWKSPYTSQDLTPQRGSTRESACFGVPYSEHSSFRELTMFCCALRIGRVIPTVNVASQKSRDQMKVWMERWDAEKKKNGLFPVTGDRW